ncbi:dihydroneopterin aldolase [Marinobacter caseinilyticus]|uniref:dihydroneopterin aldolase n=1 Tax=Marinobacter caseinilyticus TaxID=2692195 RepID=UPI001409CFDD|nr:dihydroneopterin aldolase [Marinobacter caseinilyticus]
MVQRLWGNHWVTDKVLIEGLAVEAVIGVYDWEREVCQRLLIDLELVWDNRVPGASDQVADALDYAAVSHYVMEHFQTHQPQLLEAAAELLAQNIQSEFGVVGLRLTIRKPGAVAEAYSVGVSIERGQLG